MNKRDFNVVGNEGTDNQVLAKGIAFVKSRRAEINVVQMVERGGSQCRNLYTVLFDAYGQSMIKLRYWVLGCNPNAHDIGERIFCIKTMSLYAYPVIFLYSHWYEGSDN